MEMITMNTRGESEYSVIKPTSFYSNEREKTKLNWFCYEFAVGIYDEITGNFGKRLKKYKINDKTIAEFSIYVSKEMKDNILKMLSGEVEKICFSYELIRSYFPHLNDKLVDEMVDALAKVWDDQLDFCVVCPTRCISEKDAYCSLFDDGTILL